MLLRICGPLLAALLTFSVTAAADSAKALSYAESAATRQRIVSLAPSTTETLFALGAGASVVGVSNYCDYPSEVKNLPRVGSFLTPNVEAIVGLRPTLIVGPAISSNRREFIALRAMGIPVLMVNDGSLSDIEKSITQIGAASGRAAQAQQLEARIRSHIEATGKLLRGAPSVKVLMLIGHSPLVAVGRGTFLGELLAMAHSENVADPLVQPWPRLGMEYVIAAAPAVIIDGGMGSDGRSFADFWQGYSTIPAVQEHRIYGYDAELMLRPGPRIWQSFDALASMLHPAILAPMTARSATTSRSTRPIPSSEGSGS